MTEYQILDLLCSGGNFALPYLLKFSHPDMDPICLVNNNESIVYDGETYQIATFNYTPPENDGTGGSLSISSLPNENSLFEFIENTNDQYRLDVVGVIAADGSVQKLKQYEHLFGSVSIDSAGLIDFQLSSDDRLDMMFTPYKYDTDNNRGNA